jgi:hypothetical protein
LDLYPRGSKYKKIKFDKLDFVPPVLALGKNILGNNFRK